MYILYVLRTTLLQDDPGVSVLLLYAALKGRTELVQKLTKVGNKVIAYMYI